MQKTAENSIAIGRPELNGKAFKAGYYDMAFLQILWSQNETRRMPNPQTQFASSSESDRIARGKLLFSTKVADGGSGCSDCHHNGNKFTNGVLDNTFQDFNIHEPGVVAETTVDGNGPSSGCRTITSSSSSVLHRTTAHGKTSAAATPSTCALSGTACLDGFIMAARIVLERY